jgi:hypothetical protein
MFDSATVIYVSWIQLIYIRLLRKPRDVMFRFDFTSNLKQVPSCQNQLGNLTLKKLFFVQ